MLIELDKVMSMYETAEKEKKDLLKKIKVIQGMEQETDFVILEKPGNQRNS